MAPFIWQLLEKTDITGLKVSTFRKQGSNIKLHQNLIYSVCVCVCVYVWMDVTSTFKTNILKWFNINLQIWCFLSLECRSVYLQYHTNIQTEHPVITTFKHETFYHRNMEDSIYKLTLWIHKQLPNVSFHRAICAVCQLSTVRVGYNGIDTIKP